MGFQIIQQYDVQKFLKKLAIFLVLLVALDFLVGNTLRNFYFKQDSGLEASTIYAIDKASEDLIILGSSRAQHHYVPGILSAELKESVYNAGREGNFILYHNAVLQCMLTRHKPKAVILDILNREFMVNPDSYDRLATLMPFYRSHKVLRPIINLRGPFEPVKNLSFIYPYNSKIQAIAVGNLDFNKKRKMDFNGYVPLPATMPRSPKAVKVDNAYPIDTVKIAAYRAILETCKNNNIRLFVVCSPYYDHLDKEDRSISMAREMAGEYGVPFWNLSAQADFMDKPEWFDDETHFNDTGARLFSKFIADKIKMD